MSATPIRGTRCVQSRFFLTDLRDALFMLAFFFSVARFLEVTFFATFFFVREPGFFAPIAVATLSQTTPGAAVAVAAAVAAAWANSPARILVPSAALLPAATTVFCALVLMLLRVIYSTHPLRGPRRNIVRATISLRKRSRTCAGSTRMSALPQKQTFHSAIVMSALAPIADIATVNYRSRR
jgi:hypothetical protein